MSAIASNSHWTLAPALLAGAVLSALCLNSDSTLAQSETGSAGTQSSAAQPQTHKHHWLQFGRASWYGRAFQGQTTASGEPFNMNSMTCAHRSLPLGATVLVTNLRNHRTVLVKVNDRGPVPEDRVVDLSYAAARVLGFRGLAPVRIDLVDPTLNPAKIAELSWPANFQR
jgi:rare lipoprotein A